MALVVFQHDPLDPPARLGACLRDHGHKLDVRQLHEGDPIPPDLDDVDGLLVMGGSMNVDDTAKYDWLEPEMQYIRLANEAKLPIVGVCLGAQLIAQALGGEVAAMEQPEIGWAEIKLAFPGTVDAVLAGQPWQVTQFHAHGYEVTKLPPGGVPLAGSKACKTQAYCVGSPANVYGFQYHFEWAKADIQRWLDGNADWLERSGLDAGEILDGFDSHYSMYRHLGDRLCKRLADLLYRIDRRLDHKSGVLTSFDPAVS